MAIDEMIKTAKEAVNKASKYDKLEKQFKLITNKSADEVLQRLAQTGLPSNDNQNVKGLPKLELLHELAKFYPDTPEGLGIILDAKFAGEVDNLEYNRKVKVPENVARWIEYCECHGYSLKMALEYPTPDKNYEEAAKEWILLNERTFAQAWLNGYEVEEEPKYYVEIPLPKQLNGCGRLGQEKGGRLGVLFTKINLLPVWKTKFTEQEIKDIDERYWPFAVPVEEVKDE